MRKHIKLFSCLVVCLSFVFILSSLYAEEKKVYKYPLIKESVRCLILDSSNKPVPGKYLVIEKIFSTAEDFFYSLEAGGIHNPIGSVDYSTDVTMEKPGEFRAKNDENDVVSFDLELKISKESLPNYESPSNMEPFFVDYTYKNSFFDQNDHLSAKCLHRVF